MLVYRRVFAPSPLSAAPTSAFVSRRCRHMLLHEARANDPRCRSTPHTAWFFGWLIGFLRSRVVIPLIFPQGSPGTPPSPIMDASEIRIINWDYVPFQQLTKQLKRDAVPEGTSNFPSKRPLYNRNSSFLQGTGGKCQTAMRLGFVKNQPDILSIWNWTIHNRNMICNLSCRHQGNRLLRAHKIHCFSLWFGRLVPLLQFKKTHP